MNDVGVTADGMAAITAVPADEAFDANVTLSVPSRRAAATADRAAAF